jgi:hypothetical protein
MNIRFIWLSIILFTAIILGGVSFINSVLNDGSSEINTQLYSINNSLVPRTSSGELMVSSKINLMESSVNKTEGTQETALTSGAGTTSSLMLGMWNLFKNMKDSLSFFFQTISAIGDIYPDVPKWALALAATTISALIIFAIAGIVFNRDV